MDLNMLNLRNTSNSHIQVSSKSSICRIRALKGASLVETLHTLCFDEQKYLQKAIFYN